MLENEPLSRCELICINKLGTWTWPTANETDGKSKRNYYDGGEDCNTGGVGDGDGDGGGSVVVVRARKTRKTRSLPTIVGAAGGVTSHHDGWVRQQVTVGKEDFWLSLERERKVALALA